MLSKLDNNIHCEYSNLQNEHHKTHIDGKWYKKPDKFPCVLHDKAGCLCVSKEKYMELVFSGVFREYQGRDKITFDVGNKENNVKKISEILGYKLCASKTTCPRYRPKYQKSDDKIKANISTRKPGQKRGLSRDPVAKALALFDSLPSEYQAKLLAELSAMQQKS